MYVIVCYCELLHVMYVIVCFISREILEDALPVVGTANATKTIIQKIKNGTMTGERAAWILASLGFTSPNIEVMNLLLVMCNIFIDLYESESGDFK